MDDFDKNFNRIFKFSGWAMFFIILANLIGFGVGIWAIIYVVTHIGGWIHG